MNPATAVRNSHGGAFFWLSVTVLAMFRDLRHWSCHFIIILVAFESFLQKMMKCRNDDHNGLMGYAGLTSVSDKRGVLLVIGNCLGNVPRLTSCHFIIILVAFESFLQKMMKCRNDEHNGLMGYAGLTSVSDKRGSDQCKGYHHVSDMRLCCMRKKGKKGKEMTAMKRRRCKDDEERNEKTARKGRRGKEENGKDRLPCKELR